MRTLQLPVRVLPHLNQVGLAQRILVQCEVRFDRERSELISLTLNSGQLELQQSCAIRKQGSLIFETPIQHGYEVGAEVRSLLPTERPAAQL